MQSHTKRTKEPTLTPKAEELLRSVLEVPGTCMEAYRAFHRYSFLNQLNVAYQCNLRGLPIGPIDTYRGWIEKGRQVKREQKALSMWLPIQRQGKHQNDVTNTSMDGEDNGKRWTGFIYKKAWFVVAQTEGDIIPKEVPLPTWSRDTALSNLGVTLVAFEHADGNRQGQAMGHSIAINPTAPLQNKTVFHELAHIVLGHTVSSHGEDIPRSLMEFEAECVAMLCCASLDIGEVAYSRDYCQGWMQGEETPEASYGKIIATAQIILSAGALETEEALLPDEPQFALA